MALRFVGTLLGTNWWLSQTLDSKEQAEVGITKGGDAGCSKGYFLFLWEDE